MMKYVITPLICVFLSGCIGAAITGANMAYDHRKVQHGVENQYVQLAVANALKNDINIQQPNRVVATSVKYEVLLIGQVPDEASKIAAGEDAQNTSGVKKVLNYLEVGPVISDSTQISDSWITTKIRTQIVTGNSISPKGVKVITENGVVYLMGALPREEANAVIDLARKTDGVKKVVTLLYFLDPHET
jgi:osmotically-inducible protein OsmY